MKGLRYMLICLVSCLLGSAVLAQTTHEVHLLIQGTEMGAEFYFEPVGLHIQPGDTVRFIADTPHHTVTAYHGQQGKPHRVPEGVGPFSSPVIPVWESWEMTFDIAGTYDLWCAPHEMFGMAMRLVVGEPGGPAMSPITDFGPEGVFGASGTVLSDPALEAANIVAKGSVSWAEISDAAKMPPDSEGSMDHSEDSQGFIKTPENGARRSGSETDL